MGGITVGLVEVQNPGKAGWQIIALGWLMVLWNRCDASVGFDFFCLT